MHYSQHAYGTWMPDRPQGFVHHRRGLLPTDEALADAYRSKQRQASVVLLPPTQRVVVEALCEASDALGMRCHSVATDPTHFHALFSWGDDGRTLNATYDSLRRAVTLALNGRVGRKTWFTKKAHVKRVRGPEHFAYLFDAYHPTHRGWRWCERGGWTPPVGGWTPPVGGWTPPVGWRGDAPDDPTCGS